MRLPKLLQFLLAPFFMFAGEDDAGGGAEDRGDTLDAGAPELVVDDIVDPLADDKGITDAGEENDGPADPKAKDEPKADKGKDTRIPLARHKDMMDKGRAERDALVAQIAKLQAGTQLADTNEAIDKTETKLVAMEAEYNKLLADGDIDKATAKMSEIRRLERTIGDQKSDMRSQAAEARAVERVRYDTVVERLETAFPQMNPDHEDFDKEVVGEVLELKSAFEAKGATPSAALQRAVKYVLGAETSKEKAATSVTPNVDKADVATLRKQEALKRNVAAAKATPASTAKVGLNSDEKGGTLTGETAMKLSQDDFSKITEKDLARMRGDEI